ncbi:hypothetical protein LPMP_301660 [Leishmania panamensis]|uniref:Uncharacterized protein n=1 Tax=Leishmania panamensis TaxID=5679 RepID=A0A088RWR7_LEIPA|nr:hypothetical protein LPMP_301660 [Leishmania panamensis]AIO00391.1 hypothetical protein LPMP_301660 [Leishmania panamensis]
MLTLFSFLYFHLKVRIMVKKASLTKRSAGDVATPRPGETAATSVDSTLSPRTFRQHKWAKRVDDAVIAMGHVQQSLQQHTVEVDTVKRELEELTYTAAALWAANPDELPAQYRAKQQASSQRTSNSVGSAPRSTNTTPTKRCSGSDIASLSASPGGDAVSGISGTGLESVEQTLLQLSPAQRAKVSAALQLLFYAPPIASSVEVVMDGTDADVAGDLSATVADRAAQEKSAPLAKSGNAESAVPAPCAVVSPAMVTASNSRISTAATGRRNGIPLALFLAMQELRTRRIHLEAQLTTAANATAQQLERFQLLQEELMVSQYGLEAARRDPQQGLQQQLAGQQTPSESIPTSS